MIYASIDQGESINFIINRFLVYDPKSTEYSAWIYRGAGMSYSEGSKDIIAYETLAVHRSGIHVIYGDGRVEWIKRGEATKLREKMHLGGKWPIE